ncbi:MAG: DUF1844 domain-containing protein [Planctomycetales bacterium]|nr:DUF1844 domain-containing protein [Planctomycetales bacterium]
MSAEEKKIIIDEDWKSRVQSEKEQAATQPPAGEAATSPAAEDQPLPPADFQTIVSLLATQAMISLGALPNPLDGKVTVHPQQAKHFIDLLSVLEQKTRGNLSAEESAVLERLLHELRMVFLSVGKPQPAPQDQP